MNDAIHMTLEVSKISEVKVLPAGEGEITVGALVATPSVNVPPDSGRNTPLDAEVRLVMEVIPAMLDDWAAKRPPSGDTARPRVEPATANDAIPPDAELEVAPYLTTPTPWYDAVHAMEPFTDRLDRCSLPGANEVVVSTAPFA